MSDAIKILNLYAGIGGNRKLWRNVEVTAIELNPEIADVYASLFPQDNLIITDAHQYLLNHYKKFDFIWSSRPCQSHSRFRQHLQVGIGNSKPIYPDLGLYEEIIFLQYNIKSHKTLFVVENVDPYYQPLVDYTAKLDRHLFWSNFMITDFQNGSAKIRSSQIAELQAYHGYDLSQFKISNKRQILRNCVNPELGLHIFNCAFPENESQTQTTTEK